MDDKTIQYLAPGALASAVLAFVLREWSTLYDLGVKVYDRFTRDRVDAPLEVLDFDSTIDLVDAAGKKAIFNRRMRVRFLQDHVIAFQDHVWGDGKALASYKVSPGYIVDQYRDGDRWNVLISLRQTRNRGEIEEFVSARTALDAFRGKEEWVQAETWLPTRRIRFHILFPKGRSCQRIWLHERSRQRTTPLSLDGVKQLPNGRTEFVWERKSPRRGEIFTLKWEW